MDSGAPSIPRTPPPPPPPPVEEDDDSELVRQRRQLERMRAGRRSLRIERNPGLSAPPLAGGLRIPSE